MPLVKTQAEGINLADTFAFTGTVSGTGKVLQVVTATPLAVQYYSASDNYMSTTLSLQITPSATTNKIFLQYSASCHCDTNSGYCITDIYKNPTSSLSANTEVAGGTIISGRGASGYGLSSMYGSASANISACVGMFLDSPSTTSQITYLVIYRNASAGNAYFNANSGLATFTAMEIGA